SATEAVFMRANYSHERSAVSNVWTKRSAHEGSFFEAFAQLLGGVVEDFAGRPRGIHAVDEGPIQREENAADFGEVGGAFEIVEGRAALADARVTVGGV